MIKLLLKIEYNGAHFQGWQKQVHSLTVEDKLLTALQILYKEKIELLAASRTDSGVHSRGQLATICVKECFTLPKLQKSLNALIAPYICVLDISQVNYDFSLRKNINGKKYYYQIYNSPSNQALFAEYFWHIPQKLDLSIMQQAAKQLIGQHNFKAFRASNCNSKNTIKNIKKIDWKIENCIQKCKITIYFESSGFLKQMIRIIVGSLVEIGLGKKDPLLFQKALQGGNRQDLGKTAPANALFLEKIILSNEKQI